MQRTQTETLSSKILIKAKDTIKFVLKKKSVDINKIVDDLHKELETRFNKRIEEITPKLKDANFEDPENSLKLILITVMIQELQELFKEKMLKLDDEDKSLFKKIMGEDDQSEDSQSPNKNSNFEI